MLNPWRNFSGDRPSQSSGTPFNYSITIKMSDNSILNKQTLIIHSHLPFHKNHPRPTNKNGEAAECTHVAFQLFGFKKTGAVETQ